MAEDLRGMLGRLLAERLAPQQGRFDLHPDNLFPLLHSGTNIPVEAPPADIPEAGVADDPATQALPSAIPGDPTRRLGQDPRGVTPPQASAPAPEGAVAPAPAPQGTPAAAPAQRGTEAPASGLLAATEQRIGAEANAALTENQAAQDAAGKRAEQSDPNVEGSFADQRQTIERERAEVAQKLFSDISEISTRIQNTKIDPQKLYRDASTGRRMSMALTAGISGLLSFQRGGRNTTIDMIQKQLDRELQTQQAQLQADVQGLGAAKGLLGTWMQVTGDQLSAVSLAKADYWDKVAAEAEQKGLEVQDPVIQARALEMVEQARAQAEAARQEGLRQAAEFKLKEIQTRANAFQSRAAGKAALFNAETARIKAQGDLALERDKLSAEQQAQQAADAALTQEGFNGEFAGVGVTVNGKSSSFIPKTAFAVDPKNVDKVTESMRDDSAAMRGQVQALDKLAQILAIDDYSAINIPFTELTALAEQLGNEVLVSQMKAASQGRLSDKDMDIFRDAFATGDLNKLLQLKNRDTLAARMDQAQESIINAFTGKYASALKPEVKLNVSVPYAELGITKPSEAKTLNPMTALTRAQSTVLTNPEGALKTLRDAANAQAGSGSELTAKPGDQVDSALRVIAKRADDIKDRRTASHIKRQVLELQRAYGLVEEPRQPSISETLGRSAATFGR